MTGFQHNPFEGIVDLLEENPHPEWHHVNAGSHPGEEFYLKTVCPDPALADLDIHGLGEAWHQFARDSKEHILITEQAFDWTGELIPGWNSVWLNMNYDVQYSLREPRGMAFRVLPRIEGEIHASQWLKDLLGRSRALASSLQDVEDLKRLQEISNDMSGMFAHILAEMKSQMNRQNFKVFTKDKE
jgi:hypothetical protein